MSHAPYSPNAVAQLDYDLCHDRAGKVIVLAKTDSRSIKFLRTRVYGFASTAAAGLQVCAVVFTGLHRAETRVPNETT